MKKLRAVLIGAGAIAREHLSALAGMPDVEIGGVCDRSPAIARMTAERFGARGWYTDHQRMLDEVRPDLVHVTTPPDSHFALVRSCLERGFPVFCEKPITVEYEEFLELRRMAESTGLLLVENQNLRDHSSIRRILGLVASGEIGEVVDAQVQVFLDVGAPGSRFADRDLRHPCLAMRGGAIADFLTHLAYLAHVLAGAPTAVHSVWRKRTPDGVLPVDEFRAQLVGDRATASVAFSANAQPNGFWVRVYGTRAQVEANLFEPPRVVVRRARKGGTPLGPVVDGIRESRSVFDAAILGLGRKLAGTSRYDGLPAFVSRTYAALETGEGAPVSLGEIDAVARTVAAFTRPEFTP